jgi:hypothetical protein
MSMMPMLFLGNWLLLYVYLQRKNSKKKSFRHRLTGEGRKRRQRNLPRLSLLLPTAFATNTNAYLFKSSQHVSEAEDATHMIMTKEATSMRQASEWGMRAIQGAFPRLKHHIKYEKKGEHCRILQLVPLLYNYRLEATKSGIHMLESGVKTTNTLSSND